MKALSLLLLSLAVSPAGAQTVIPRADPAERPGPRPYEMVWAARTEPAPPTLRFDDLRGWTMSVSGGAQADLRPSRAQDLWNRPVGRLRYRGDGNASSSPTILLTPPQPVAVPAEADCAELWVYGNRWDFENPPDTPPVRIALRLRDAKGADQVVPMDTVRWKEWWLLHRKLPAAGSRPLTLVSIEVAGGWQPAWREIFLESLRFFRERRGPLSFAPRPRRNLTLFAGQDAGANTGPGRLPFPTREETILPPQLAGACRNDVRPDHAGYVFRYAGRDGGIQYRFDPARFLSGIRAEVNGAGVGTLMDGAAVKTGEAGSAPALAGSSLKNGIVTARYTDGTTLRLQIRQKSLIVDVENRSAESAPAGSARAPRELTFGQMTGLTRPRAIYVPPITCGGSNPTVLLSKAGPAWVYTSLWPDWYRSNGSELYGAEYAAGSTARINGGVRYLPRTDGRCNPMFERLFLTVSPRFEEVLPTIPNPVGLHAAEAGERLWQESWGPADYAKEMQRSAMLRAYGIEKLIQCNHEITWRDGGESFTLRTRAAPGKGGDEALKRYVAHQRGLGWLSGLYTNYTDFAPVNAHWTPDYVQREPSGEWRSAWPRNYALKPLAAVELDAKLAPVVHGKFGTNSAYTDVQTAAAPWAYNDYDARVPGAGTFAQTFYAYGELLRNDSRVYGGPIFSEGTYQWLYAGLADGNYGLTYNGHHLATDPLLPVFDLSQIHTRECDIGVPWTSFFAGAIPDWQAPRNLDRTIDRFLLTTLAYGHLGWLVEEQYGMDRACRSYYMMQQVQKRYALKDPSRIAYWDGKRLEPVSQALVDELPRTRRQLYVAYPGGLELWLNDHPTEEWVVHPGGRRIVLPPAGWAAWQPASSDGGLFSYSARFGAGKQDYLKSDAYTYLDGRSRWMDTPEAGFSGALAIRPAGRGRLEAIRIAGDGPFLVRRPYGTTGTVTGIAAFDVDGKRLAPPRFHDGGGETWVEPVPAAIRYEIAFTGRPAWSAAPAATEAAAGTSVDLKTTGRRPVRWQAAGGQVRGGRLFIPASAPVGSLVTVRAISGGETREAALRVCAPVAWTWRATTAPDSLRLRFALSWRLAPADRRAAALTASASAGWTVSPARIPAADLAGGDATFTVRSSAPPGAVGRLEVRMEGLPNAPTAVFLLKRVAEAGVAADLREPPAAWGIARRGGPETPEPGDSGAVCYLDGSLTVGGVTKPGIFMHPPYNGGVGYTWLETKPIVLPWEPVRFEAQVGIKDGGDASDGVLFRVEVVDAAGMRHVAGEALGVQHTWRPLVADLSLWEGQRVRLRLIADPGPHDNAVADWGSLGEPVIRRAAPRVTTEITADR